MDAIIVELISEEIIYGNKIILNLNSDKPTYDVVIKRLHNKGIYVTVSGKQLTRNSFRPLLKYAMSVNGDQHVLLGQLPYQDQLLYNPGDKVTGTVAKVPARVRVNDGVLITDSQFIKDNELLSNYGAVVSTHETSIPTGCAVRLSDGDYVIVPRKSFVITSRPNIIRVFNISK